MTQHRQLLSAIKDALTDPPDWATKYIFGGTLLAAVVAFVGLAIGGEASPTAVLALIGTALVLPWLIYWMLLLAFLAGTLALGAALHLIYLAGRTWRGERLFDE